ncbi:hypothetical protein BB558_000802 [Smittium angustum]|uniref:Protein-lysine N-methyltransferase EFM4 n=1 Tax=Smittium angustum TaxID=133377 RepID=A0A2U1JDF0_SMIAN|nr:hypothetical protein BB558_000802 [Smittium angustum]
MEQSSEFGASELGTKQYWDNRYATELENYKDHKDIGEVWFGEDIAEKVVDWVEDLGTSFKNKPLIDIGCGNAHLLFMLSDLGYTCLVGTDYSKLAIDLATNISENTENSKNIKFIQANILEPNSSAKMCDELSNMKSNDTKCMKYSIILDKGTFDAICLKPVDESNKDEISKLSKKITEDQDKNNTTTDFTARNSYIDFIRNIIEPSEGIFLITSCNWTEDELKNHFGTHFLPVGRINHRSFTFGGIKGQTVSSVAFKLK